MQSVNFKLYLLLLAIATGLMVNKTEGIVAGQYTAPTEVPYIVSLRTNAQHFCGGSIISYYHILTAAHCLDLSSGVFIPGLSYVVAGTTMKQNHGTLYRIYSYLIHPYFSMHPASQYKYDIAILTLSSKIEMNEHKKIIRLLDSPLPSRSPGIAAGWGQPHFMVKQGTPVLLKLQTTVMNGEECYRYRPFDQDIQSIVCSLVETGHGGGTCQGDSGGPLVVDNTLVGIVSNGILCAAGSPDVFTSIYFYKSWIKGVIKQTGVPGITKHTPASDFYSKSSKSSKSKVKKTKKKKSKKAKTTYSAYPNFSADRDDSYYSDEFDESEVSYYEFENGVWNAVSC